MIRIVVLSLVAMLGLSGCNTDAPKPVSFEDQLAKDRVLIDSYLSSKAITALTDPDNLGVRYVITVPGTGIKPVADADSVTVNYKLRLLPSETLVDQSTTPVRFLLGNLITGWQIGLPLINEGSKATFYVPSGWAYGTTQVGSVPPNSNLIFDVELIKVFPQLKKDTLAINDYLAVQNISNVLKGPEGLKYVIITLGTGTRPTATSSVTFTYSGSLLSRNSATLFDRSSNPITSALSGLIKGLRIGIPLLPVGTKATFYIPSTLGYGLRGTSSIPSNSNIIFDIELTAATN